MQTFKELIKNLLFFLFLTLLVDSLLSFFEVLIISSSLKILASPKTEFLHRALSGLSQQSGSLKTQHCDILLNTCK